MPNKTFKTIVQGDFVNMTIRGETTTEQFLGFTDNDQKYSEEAAFVTLDELKKDKGVTTIAELSDIEEQSEYGYHFYALFMNLSEGHHWGAYIYNGAFVAGSSADKISMTG